VVADRVRPQRRSRHEPGTQIAQSPSRRSGSDRPAYVIETERRGFKVESDVEEEAWWLADALMKRTITNNLQRMCITAAETCHKDPAGALRTLAEDSSRAVDVVGKAGADLGFEKDVLERVRKLRVEREARRLLDLKQQGGRTTLSWSPVDLTDALDSEWEPLVPTLFERTDGVFLIYPGMTHSFHGEPGSAKSLMMQWESARLVNQGEDVLYVDFDSDEKSVVARLVEFGSDPEKVKKHFHYLHPEASTDSPEEEAAWNDTLSRRYALAVVDNVTEAFAAFGYSSSDNDDIARWVTQVPKRIAARTGAPVVLIDHVVKDKLTRGRWAIGGQAKLAGLTGAAYTVEVHATLGRGIRGEAVLRVGKDRPGSVTPHCGPLRKSDRTQEAARVVIDSTVTPPTVTVNPPAASTDREPGSPNFRPTFLMERVSRLIEEHPGQLTKTQAAKQVSGRREYVLAALDLLVSEEYLKTGPERYPLYTSTKTYREKDDPQSDKYFDRGDLLRRAKEDTQPEEAAEDD
jgi:AAA domain